MQLSKFLDVLEPALAEVKAATGWAKCELQVEGKDAGKVVVKRGLPANSSASTGSSNVAAPVGDHAQCDPYDDI
ncbi:hypothetical protein [Paraburkholderia sp.]|uniref:hypothetical protein n=1 Tax=Paraburkholderia sp. TaxID=1926495 RepID=UPI003C7A3BA6